MTLFQFGLILSGVLLNAGAQLLLKAGATRLNSLPWGSGEYGTLAMGIATNTPILGGLACYVVSVAIWIAALTKVPVSIAYPMLSIGYVVNAIAAYYLFAEGFNLTKILGIGLIVVGVVLVGISKN
jgi:multidrug transporter EmrE-like cation transporter